MIQLRRLKEESACGIFDFALGADVYLPAVASALTKLTVAERKAFILRFIEYQTIASVADRMSTTWEKADHLIDKAIRKIGSRLRNSKLAMRKRKERC